MKKENKVRIYIESFLMTSMLGITLFNSRDLDEFGIPSVSANANMVTLNDTSSSIEIEVVDDEDIIDIEDENPNKNNLDFLIKNGIDANKGIELLGDIVMYNDMLAEFNEEIDARIERLKAYKDTDLKSYTIEVHSLKSDSQYLGFTKLADFALTKQTNNEAQNRNYNNKIRGYSKSADIYDIGAILYEMICGTPPFYLTYYKSNIKNKENELIFEDYFSDDLKDLISKLLFKDPNKRIGLY